MINWADEFPFLKDPELQPEYKKIFLEKFLEERARREQGADKRAADQLERLKFWHNTPLVVALVGTITIFANAFVGYFQSKQTTANSITIKQVESLLSDSQKRSDAERERQLAKLKSDLQETASKADAARVATKEERDFAYRIVETELAKSGDTRARATVLLFLVRAGVLNSLNRDELQKMALEDLQGAKNPGQAVIPPTLGRFGPVNICVGNGGGASCLGPGVVAYTCAEYKLIGGGGDATYDTFNKRFCQGKGDSKTNVRHNFSIDGGECGWTSFTVACPS
jgi:predicted negative regulator of RcsB-dependent stress response